MAEPLGIAVIGAGAIGRTHIDTLGRMPDLRLAAIVDPFGQELAAQHGVPGHADVAALIAAGGVQAAIVATPNETHLPISEALLRAGLPVLLEKPVAESLDSALRLCAVADETGVPLLIGHHRRHNPIIQTAHRAIREGAIGDLVMASVITALAKPENYFAADWRRRAGVGGPLLINLVHEIDLLRHFFGEIASVQAMVGHERRGLPVEDSATVGLHFAGGGLASLTISDAAVGPWAWDLTAGENLARMPAHEVSAHHYAGSKAGLSLPDLTLWQAPGGPDWSQRLQPTRLPLQPADVYERQLAHFAGLVRNGGTPLVSARDATANIIVLDAIAEAARTGRQVAVDLAPLA